MIPTIVQCLLEDSSGLFGIPLTQQRSTQYKTGIQMIRFIHQTLLGHTTGSLVFSKIEPSRCHLCNDIYLIRILRQKVSEVLYRIVVLSEFISNQSKIITALFWIDQRLTKTVKISFRLTIFPIDKTSIPELFKKMRIQFQLTSRL